MTHFDVVSGRCRSCRKRSRCYAGEPLQGAPPRAVCLRSQPRLLPRRLEDIPARLRRCPLRRRAPDPDRRPVALGGPVTARTSSSRRAAAGRLPGGRTGAGLCPRHVPGVHQLPELGLRLSAVRTPRCHQGQRSLWSAHRPSGREKPKDSTRSGRPPPPPRRATSCPL